MKIAPPKYNKLTCTWYIEVNYNPCNWNPEYLEFKNESEAQESYDYLMDNANVNIEEKGESN